MFAPARADAEEPGIPFGHPLMSANAQQIVADHPEFTLEEIYRHLHVFDEISERADGTETRVSSVVWVDDPEPALTEPSPEPARGFSTDAVVGEWLEAPATAPIEVDVVVVFWLDWDDTVSVMHQRALAMLSGEVQTEEDYEAVRANIVGVRIANGNAAMAEALDLVTAAGGEVVNANPQAGTARVRADLATLAVISARSDVARIEQYHEATDDSIGIDATIEGPVDGHEVADYVQSNPYYDRGYEGRIYDIVGVVESKADEIHNEHVSFDNAVGTNRVSVCEAGTGSTCTYVSITDGAQHPTKVASIIAGDLTEGQDGNFVNANPRFRRSGIARKVNIRGMTADDIGRVADIMGSDGPTHIVNQSFSATTDPLCLGSTSSAKEANSLYEAGLAVINSAGNNDWNSGTTDDCTSGDEANAIGTLAVNAVKVTDPTTTSRGVPIPSTEVLHEKSSRGGTSAEGEGRTIIDLVQLTGHNYRADAKGSVAGDYASATHRFGITSAAAPTVSGIASLFRQWYRHTQSSLIDDPGILYANLLLQGDGLTGLPTETFDHKGFSDLFGAGRLRLRAFDAAGLDAPAAWGSGSVCVAHQQTHILTLNGGSDFPVGVDYIKAVTWWYDHGHGHDTTSGTIAHDQYQLSIHRNDAGTWYTADLDTSTDNKQRVFEANSDVGNGQHAFRLHIHGADVSSDNEGCGTNSNRVHYAYLWEENDRDDDTALSTYVRPEPEVD